MNETHAKNTLPPANPMLGLCREPRDWSAPSPYESRRSGGDGLTFYTPPT